MNRKPYTILFYIILAGSFLHETTGNPSIPQINCTNQTGCNEQLVDGPGLSVKGNNETGRLLFLNESCNGGLIIDIILNTATIINGNEGAAVIFHLQTNELTCIPRGICDIRSLLYLNSSDLNGEDCDANSEEVLEFLKRVYNCGFKVDKEKIDQRDAIVLDKEICTKFVALLKGDLKGVIKFFEVELPYIHDFPGLYSLFEGFATVYHYIPGGFLRILKNITGLDSQALITSKNGLEWLSQILFQIGQIIPDLPMDLEPVLNDPVEFLQLVAQLGSMESTGLNGILKVLSVASCYVKGEIKLEVVINVIIQVLVNERKNQNLEDCLNKYLQNLLSTVGKLKATKELSGLVDTINDLMNGNFTVGGVNMSRIFEELLEGIASGQCSLEALVKIVLELTKSCKSEEDPLLSILLVLIVDINNPLYLDLIENCIDVNAIECKYNTNYTDCDEDFYNILISLPGVKEVIESLETAISEATEGETNLKNLLYNDNGDNSINAALAIKNYTNCDVNECTIKEINKIANEATNLTVYFGIDICQEECN